MMSKLLRALKNAFAVPTAKQMEAYGRYAHNLSAACIIGAATILYSTAYGVVDVVRLVATGVVLFLGGAVLSKGD